MPSDVPKRRLGYYCLEIDGKTIELPSVTTILRVIDKPALMQWAARMAAKAVLVDPVKFDTPEKAAAAIYTISDTAMTRGSEAHKVADAYAGAYVAEKTDEFKSDSPYFGAIKSFFDTMRPRVLYKEVRVVNVEQGYAGTADLIARIGPKTFVVDYKCLAENEPVLMADGTEKAARMVHHGDMIAAWDGKQVALAKVAASGDNGTHDVLKIVTHTGRQVSATEKHPFLTSRGWVRAMELKEGDAVRVAGFVPSNRQLSAEDAYLLGLMIGDGCLGAKCSLTNSDSLIIDFIEKYAISHGMKVTTEDRHRAPSHTFVGIRSDTKLYRNPVRQLIRDSGLFGTKAGTKFVPQNIMRSGMVWPYFLAGYLDTDGHVLQGMPGASRKADRERSLVQWVSKSHELLRGARTILTGLGVRSILRPLRQHHNNEIRIYWTLNVQSRAGLEQLKRAIPPMGKRSRAISSLTLTEPRRKKDGSPWRYGSPVLEWDPIVTIERIEAQPTVWIEVEKYHTHITDGIVSHNTGKAVYPEARLQVEAYRQCTMVILQDGTRIPTYPIADAGGVVLLKDDGTFAWTETTADHTAFLAALVLFHWQESLK